MKVWILVFVVTQPWASIGGVFESHEKCGERLAEIGELMESQGFDVPHASCVAHYVE